MNQSMNNFSLNNESCLIMSIINATNDSFSGDGIYSKSNFDLNKELDLMSINGVDIIDVGGESTRPKKVYKDVVEISANEELDRVIPIIENIKKNSDIFISIDSKKPIVLDEAIKAGAVIANDISMLEDEDILEVINKHNVHYVLGHFRQNKPHQNILTDVLSDLSEKIDILNESGFDRNKIILDPGIGFGKKFGESKDIFANIEILKKSFNLPIMIGTSRKSFIGEYTQKKIDNRIFGTAATTAFAVLNGANIIRVHDYEEMIDVKKMIQVLKDSRYKL